MLIIRFEYKQDVLSHSTETHYITVTTTGASDLPFCALYPVEWTLCFVFDNSQTISHKTNPTHTTRPYFR